jgi:hypothetical protein
MPGSASSCMGPFWPNWQFGQPNDRFNSLGNQMTDFEALKKYSSRLYYSCVNYSLVFTVDCSIAIKIHHCQWTNDVTIAVFCMCAHVKNENYRIESKSNQPRWKLESWIGSEKIESFCQKQMDNGQTSVTFWFTYSGTTSYTKLHATHWAQWSEDSFCELLQTFAMHHISTIRKKRSQESNEPNLDIVSSRGCPSYFY